MSKKKDKKVKAEANGEIVDYKAEVKRLRKENKDLRSRLEKISRMAQDVPDAEVLVNPDLLDEEIADVDHDSSSLLVNQG
jgi:hypothetical protein